MLCILVAESIPRNASGNNFQRHGIVVIMSCLRVPSENSAEPRGTLEETSAEASKNPSAGGA